MLKECVDMFDVNFDDFHKKEFLLPDGDEVTVLVGDRGAADNVQVTLSIGTGIWWKGIQSGSKVLCECQDEKSNPTATLSLDTLYADGLQLWKAKFLGVHTQMYNIVNPRSWAQGGKEYLFIWFRD